MLNFLGGLLMFYGLAFFVNLYVMFYYTPINTAVYEYDFSPLFPVFKISLVFTAVVAVLLLLGIDRRLLGYLFMPCYIIAGCVWGRFYYKDK